MDIWGGHSWFPLGIKRIEEEEDGNDLKTWFKNLYWSRMISLQEDVPDQFERYPMVEDIEESSETIKALEYEGEEEYEFIFEPSWFVETHGELKLIVYKMSDIQLHS